MSLVTIRPGVSFNAPAALSFSRMEAQIGRQIGTNRTTVPYNEQKKLYEEWLAGMHPDIPVVLDPDDSIHVYRDWDANSALAADSDEYSIPWVENGWVQVNSEEPWHREYRAWKDQHINDVTEIGDEWMRTIEVWTCPAWEASGQRVVTNGNSCQTYPAGWGQALINNGAQYTAFDTNDNMLFAVQVVYELNGLATGDITNKLNQLIADSGADVAYTGPH